MGPSAPLDQARVAMSTVALGGEGEINASGDTLFVVKADERPSNAEIAARLSEDTFDALEGDPPRVVISRDDNFADALASGSCSRTHRC